MKPLILVLQRLFGQKICVKQSCLNPQCLGESMNENYVKVVMNKLDEMASFGVKLWQEDSDQSWGNKNLIISVCPLGCCTPLSTDWRCLGSAKQPA